MKKNLQENSILLDIPLFATLSDSQLEKMRQGMSRIKLGANETLFRSDQTADRFFIVTRGKIKLFRATNAHAEKIIDIVRPGETIAIPTLFMELVTYPVSAEALQDSTVLAFSNQTFLEILKQSTQTCFRVMAEMSKRLHRQVSEIDQLSLSCAPRRVAVYLLEKTPQEEAQLQLDGSKQVIASRLSIKPETFSRILNTLSKKEMIQVDRRTIHITNRDALKKFASGDGCKS
ncbi:MAG: Crp/Fnr family transcriptional regulator [Magnetococcales bacterium]|nr:Crp/Fnr family transcriptional regulator [Magnetococcales bacterium]